MTNFIIKSFLSDCENPRTKSGTISGITGILCNIILCISKFIAGFITGSIAITADAVNNLSDASSNIVTVFSSKISSKPNDREHPFGHGRMEYVSAMIVSFMIMVMGFEIAKSSIEKLINPQEIDFSIVSIIILTVSVLVKLWMGYFNARLYKEYNNINLKAVMKDSYNDCISTAATIAALLITRFTGFKQADSLIGIAVAVIVLISGIQSLKEVTTQLLGKMPDKSVIQRIESIITENEIVLGVHDIFIHDYGANKIIASAHAEVPDDSDIITIHNIIDTAERKIQQELNITICIHMDPINKKSNTDNMTEKKEQSAE